MANVTAYTEHIEQPAIEGRTWPVRIGFEGGTVVLEVGGERPELAAWCREFAEALLRHADLIDADVQRGREDAAALRRMVAEARGERP